MSYCLIVIDMQERFNAAMGERVGQNCLREIQQAIKDDAHIIFLEYFGCGPTMSELTQALHTQCHFRQKSGDDGSAEVEMAVLLNQLPKQFKVCGVNTDCCVYQTVRGLTSRFPMANINVIADACDSDWSHGQGIQNLLAMQGNVKVNFSKEESDV